MFISQLDESFSVFPSCNNKQPGSKAHSNQRSDQGSCDNNPRVHLLLRMVVIIIMMFVIGNLTSIIFINPGEFRWYTGSEIRFRQTKSVLITLFFRDDFSIPGCSGGKSLQPRNIIILL